MKAASTPGMARGWAHECHGVGCDGCAVVTRRWHRWSSRVLPTTLRVVLLIRVVVVAALALHPRLARAPLDLLLEDLEQQVVKLVVVAQRRVELGHDLLVLLEEPLDLHLLLRELVLALGHLGNDVRLLRAWQVRVSS